MCSDDPPLAQWLQFFLPRDAMRKRGLCCGPVSLRLSVHPSRWCIVSRRLKISSNFFVGPVAHHSSFLMPSAGTNSKGNSFSGAQNTRGWENFAIFE